jgi:outer membrane protein OmpA-like peptidoglycan-associated protein
MNPVRPMEVPVHRLALLLLSAFAAGLAWAGDLGFGYSPAPAPGENPAFLVTPSRPAASMRVVIEAGGKSYEFTRGRVAGGAQQRFEWKRDDRVTTAVAWVQVEFSDQTTEEVKVPFSWTYGAPLSVDLSRASADVAARTLSVDVTARVERAEIIAYGARKAVLDERTVDVGAGPGRIEVPWVGDPGEVVLLDVKLHADNAWAGFTYSPWFLNIPHDDVLFESNSDVIPPSEVPKLQATLAQLRDVLDKYGAVVPVKLYIAGCTDTVGPADHNRDLSARRARAIARWLRQNGYDKPIFYHGFGESLLAVPTGDNVDMAANRRALYMVGANPPGAGSGVPGVSWTPL